MKEAVIIGAGQTGRGFIAPILQANAYHITFVDKNETLIKQLNEEKEYTIRYFNDALQPIQICGYDAYPISDQRITDKLAQADLITTSVFAGNLKELVPRLKKATEKASKKPLHIICCENGVHVKKPFADANIDAILSEGVIFCTTLRPHADQLLLISEDIPELPIDGSVEGMDLDIVGMPLEHDFPSLIQRKIYTYNFLSAVIAYLGDYLGYEVYAQAANDLQIMHISDQVLPTISMIIAKEYHVEATEQLAFTQRAITKFRNQGIQDTIYRNARQATRKLKPEERLYEPLRLAIKYEQKTGFILLVIAAAMHYAVKKEGAMLSALLFPYETLHKDELIKKLYVLFEQDTPLQEIVCSCADI